MLRDFGLVVALAVVGCGSADGGPESDRPPDNGGAGAPGGAGGETSPPDGEPVCEAGRQVECPCPNDGKGVQACADDGAKWEACQCESVKPAPPADPPSIGCDVFEKVDRADAGCPLALPLVAVCPKAYEESEVCARGKDGIWSCCPAES